MNKQVTILLMTILCLISNAILAQNLQNLNESFPKNGDDFFESFENGIPSDWAHIDADGDGHFWFLGSVLMPAPQYTFFPHTGEDMICSESFSNMVGVGILHPDNYIVTRKLKIGEGASFSFWACAQQREYPNEHFGVAISTGSQTEPADFTMIQEWTLSPKGENAHGEWHNYSVDLNEYAGQEAYLAIRHFNCSDNFYINVDDVEFIGGTTIGVSEEISEEINIYPNPTKGITTIQGKDLQHITLFDNLGQEVFSTEANGNQWNLDLGSFRAGYYVVKVESGEGVKSLKILVY